MRSELRLPFYLVLPILIAACSDDPAGITTTAPPVEITLPATTDTTLPATTTVPETTTTVVGLGYRWEVGDCLRFGGSGDLPYEPFGSDPLTACDEAYTHEVYYTGTFPEGEEAAYPEDSINPEIRDICIEAFLEYLGVLPVEVGLDIVMYLPDADEWAGGLRYQACLVYRPAGLDVFQELTGSLASLGADFRLDVSPGDCFAAPYIKLPTVDCAQTHLAEAIGTITHPAETGAPFPGEEQLELFALSECNLMGADYVVESAPTNPVVAFARAFTELEWEAGWRDLHCLAIALGRDGAVMPVRGSFAQEGWTVVEGDQRA